MKLTEIKNALDDEPLLITLMRQRLEKGERIARYYRVGEALKPMWIIYMERGTSANKATTWNFHCNKAGGSTWVSYPEEGFDDNFELLPGKTKGAWMFRRRGKTVNEGMGEQVMEFVEYLDKYSLTPKQRDLFEKLGMQLLKLNFHFDFDTDVFRKQDQLDDGTWLILLPSFASATKQVHISYIGTDENLGCESTFIADAEMIVADLGNILSGIKKSALDPL